MHSGSNSARGPPPIPSCFLVKTWGACGWKKVTLREKKTSLAKEERGEEYLLLEGEQGVWMEISRVLANTSQESHRG